MATAPALPQSLDNMQGGAEAVDEAADTDLARPSLMSSRPLLQRNALMPFAVFDKVGLIGCCPPRHPTYFDRSFLETDGTL
jgi:hypothetical protein